MLRTIHRVFLLLLTLGLTSAVVGQETGFTPLFDGSTLSGWVYGKEALERKTETADKRFFVGTGTIVLAAKDKDGKKDVRELVTKQTFNKDFILRLEFKAAQEATGSVTVRGTAFPVGDFVRRNEYKNLKNFKNDGWNELEITVRLVAYAENRRLNESDTVEAEYRGGKAIVKVNGREVDPNQTLIQIEGIASVNGQTLTNTRSRLMSTGPIGLKTGSGKIEFRNIRYRELR
ncbi:MAG: DUF1080 domain-containing protein [Gemmataceae bacterium]|nr:DUF1080 domain-containing protein [Gemmataceae bacterium]MDW8266036.1 DUF1080 domain-containing protein [Gemmataceae bacterium]